MNDAEWRDYIAHKDWQVQQAEKGDTLQAKGVLDDAAIALRGVLLGELPGADRVPSLRFLLSAIERIQDDVKPDIALGLWCNNRPKTAGMFDRDLVLFIKVGEHYEKLKEVKLALAKAAREKGATIKVARNAWEHFGGLDGWKGWLQAVAENA